MAEKKEIVIQAWTSDFKKSKNPGPEDQVSKSKMKLNCGAKRHHYSMFNVQR
jgi:hypothetical protein